jgi:putative flavoprotein involved in K+ transport
MLEEYAASFAAPVVDGTTVEEVRASGREASPYTVSTDSGTWHARHLVIATGPHGTPVMPAGINRADLGDAEILAARDYRNPAQVAPGGVLVVGASASGVQIAEELQRAGRQVTLAVGRHTRLPRQYRGFDVFWWLEATGRLSQTFEDPRDRRSAQAEPSLQLIGRHHSRRPASEVDLAALQRHGVRLTGRLVEATGGIARFDDRLATRLADADRAMHRFLDTVDDYAHRAGLDPEIWSPERPEPVLLPARPVERIDLRAEGISTVVVAAGYRPHHPWLRLPVSDADGAIVQSRGVTSAPGVYTVGQRLQHTRGSGQIAGARHDAAYVVDQITRTPQQTCVSRENAS